MEGRRHGNVSLLHLLVKLYLTSRNSGETLSVKALLHMAYIFTVEIARTLELRVPCKRLLDTFDAAIIVTHTKHDIYSTRVN